MSTLQKVLIAIGLAKKILVNVGLQKILITIGLAKRY